MFERKIEETTAFLIRETIGDQGRITSRQITASSMPHSLKAFFNKDVNTWVEDEKQRLLASTHFLYSDDEILGKFDSIIEILPDYAQFTELEYQEAQERNVKLLFNYVCRPQWSLVRYFFSDREHVPTDEIINGLKYFWHYEYYRLILTEYFSKKTVTVIDARKFKDLVENIDQEITRNFDSKKLASLTEPIFELFNIGSEAETPVVPIEALSIFFDDKSLTSIVDRLDREKSQREYLTMHDLVLLIGDVDYTMSLDISSIVTQHARSLGVMSPERISHAGRDFEVPIFPTMEQEPVDITDGDKHLDFVITDQEQGVIERDFDSVDASGDAANAMFLEEEADLDIPLPDSDEVETDEEAGSTIGTEAADLENDDESEGAAYNFSEAGILQLEDELYPEEYLEETADPAQVEGFDPEEIVEEASVDALDDRNTIAELGLIDEEVISYSANSLINDDIELNVSLEDEDDSSPRLTTSETGELEIDWEKEAASIPDLSIEDEIQPRASEGLPSPAKIDEDLTFKPAEELLSQLNLDDFDDLPAPQPARNHPTDIPLIDNDVYPSRQLSLADKDNEEPPIPAEDVIRQFGDLLQQINSSEQKKYAKKLFKKNEDTIRHALAVLNGKPTWREASEYIDELFIKYDVDMYSRIAVQFTDDIYKRYLPRK